jgi:superfamily II DNA or RNA helicase
MDLSDRSFPPSAQAPVLRPYQKDLVDRILTSAARRILAVAPTGSGKMVMALALIEAIVAAGGRVLFLAHRRELILQPSRALYVARIDHGVLLPDHAVRLHAPVQIASKDTIHARCIRSERFELPAADAVLVDEAHHTPAKTYRDIVGRYREARIIGWTATPCRGDGRGLGDDYGVLIECPQIGELIELGFLVPTKVYAPYRPDLRSVKVERGDYVEAQLAERMDRQQLVGDIVDTWRHRGEGRRTVVFATGVGHSMHIRDEFRRAGVLAEHVDGTTPVEERDEILVRLAAGAIDVVTNCMVLTEGWDCPEVSCAVLARPTRHHGLYRQMVGRLLRPCPEIGKTDALVLDHAGAVFEHGFVEEPVIWTLAPDKRAESPHQIARAHGYMPLLTVCPECKAIRRQGHPCPCCGWRPQPKPVAVDILEGELGEVSRQGVVTAPTDDPERFRGELAAICQERKYNPGWIAHKFRERYGVWPPRPPARPVEPSRATRRWLAQQNAAWRASQQGGQR